MVSGSNMAVSVLQQKDDCFDFIWLELEVNLFLWVTSLSLGRFLRYSGLEQLIEPSAELHVFDGFWPCILIVMNLLWFVLLNSVSSV